MPGTKSPFQVCIALLFILCFAPAAAWSQEPTPTSTLSPTATPLPVNTPEATDVATKTFERLEWRNIGPAYMSGRVADVEGVPGNPNLVYVASASGGLWKTTNGGTTWKPIFERQGTISIGDIALEPGNPDVIWVGTGESNVRNSVSFGDGVYRSTDGGNTWQHMGLRDTRYISKIVISPRDPNVVYVGALGHIFGPNEERGVFMTTDGGKTWTKTLYLDADHGVADLEIDRANPNILYAAMWNFKRTPWTHTSGSEKGGVFKSIDGGRTWKKLTEGLPKVTGRIGLAIAPSNPNVVYAITEAKEGTLYRSDDRGETWRNVSKQANIVSRGFYYTRVRVDPQNENCVYAVASTLFVSIDGGKSFQPISRKTHVDFHALWIDPLQPKRIWQGQDGGVAVSNDQGQTWKVVQNLPLGQFYQVHADNRLPFYYVSGGLQDNGTWTGPSRTREPAGIQNDDWRMISFGDGFFALNHQDDPDLYISESQGGDIVRTDARTREQQAVAPYLGNPGGPATAAKYRFNWNSPIVQSPHEKNTVYLGGSVVFRSTDFGKTWSAISPDLSSNDKERQKAAGGPVAFENTGAEYYATVISFAESPLKSGVLWAGTDDGNLHVSADAGKSWKNIISSVPGLGPSSSVTHIEPSRTDERLVYVTFDRHMLDDLRPYIYRSSDGGNTWKNISSNLPANAYVWVVKEDPKIANMLYAGTELGLFVSYDAGGSWTRLTLKNLPNVAVHDIVVHPRENDLILATHGRGLWILDDATPIQQLNPAAQKSDVILFDIRSAMRYTTRFTRYGIGDENYTAPNPSYGALISYYLKTKPDDKTKPKIEIFDEKGKKVADVLNPAKEQGLNRVSWNLRYGGPQVRRPPTDEEEQFTGGPRGPQVLPGTYTVKLTLGDKSYEKRVEVRLDPTISVPAGDMQAQLDMLTKLRDMQSAANSGLRALDSLKGQLDSVEKTVKDRLTDVPKDLSDKLAEQKQQMEALQNTLAAPEGQLGVDGTSQLADRIGGLFFTVDSANAAPTPAMREEFGSLSSEFNLKMAEVNSYLAKTVPQLNALLRRNDAPTLMTGKPIELPK